MAAEDNDHTARLSSLTSALRSIERPRSEPDRAPDPANLPLIRDPLPSLELFAPERPVTLFASEQPVTEPPAVPADSVLRRLSASVQANRRLLGGVCVALVLVVGARAGVRRLWPRVRASMSSAPAPVATAPAEAAPAGAAPADAVPATAAPVDAPPGSTTAAASTPHDVQLPPDPGRRRRPQSVAAAPSPADAAVPATATSLESEVSAAAGPVSPVVTGSSSPAKEANVTFGPGDAEVIPPKVIDAQTIIKLRPVTPGIRHDALIITVVVNEQGLVESARAVMPPRTGESVDPDGRTIVCEVVAVSPCDEEWPPRQVPPDLRAGGNSRALISTTPAVRAVLVLVCRT